LPRKALLKFGFVKADMALGRQEPLWRSWSDQPISEEIPMSTAAISSSSIYQQVEQYFQARQSDLQQLGQALGSGDLAGAQTAYNNIVQLGQSGPFASGDPFSRPQREQDFSAIGQALQAGDLAGAQAAFSTLQSTFQRGAGTQAAPSATPASSSGPEIILNLSNSSSISPTSSASPASSSGPEIILNLSNRSSGASPEQITINLNPTSGGGEQVSIGVGNQGSNEQQITSNLSANSNEQIVLNLLGESSSTSTGSSSSGSSASGGLNVSA
jgi:hypothetical protein